MALVITFVATLAVLVSGTSWNAVQAAETVSEALAECGNLHHLEFHSIPTAEAVYSNDNCALKCSVGGKVLSDDSLNEGFSCPKNPNGICHSGKCIVTSVSRPNDALRECGNLHHIDFLHQNGSGTQYSDSQCGLKCVLSGTTISTNILNEGFPCPDNQHGTCRQGHCVVEQTTNSPVITTQAPTTLPTPRYPFVIKEFEFKIFSAKLLSNIKGLYAMAHLEELDPHTHMFHPKTQYCTTTRVVTATNVPYWNTNCHFADGHHFETCYLVIYLYDEHGNFIGSFKAGIYALLQAKYQPGSSRITLENNFPIVDMTKNVGEFHLIFNVTLV